MKRFAAVGAICVSFLLGAVAPALAQDEHHGEKEARHEEKRDAHAEKREVHEVKREEHRQLQDEHHRRIADEHFREHFGREHHFAVRHVTYVGGRPHFVYGGYSFEVGEHWPARWAYTDECYIDFVGGGYYLFDVRHPGVRVAVTVLP